jgi:transposase
MASRRKFTPEYKAEAVALVVESGRSVKDVAESLSIHENTLGNWIIKAKERGDVPEKPLTLPERAELEKLRKDYAQSQMDLAFLKKAAAWFASENK